MLTWQFLFADKPWALGNARIPWGSWLAPPVHHSYNGVCAYSDACWDWL